MRFSACAITALVLAAPPAPAQEESAPADKPLLALRDELTMKQFIEKLERHGWAGVNLGEVDAKRFKVDIKDAGFCRVLDELCRAHGDATYFQPMYRGLRRPDTTLHGEPWVAYPTSYHGHYKVIVSHLLHLRRRTADEEQQTLGIRLVLFGPPWARINYAGVSRPTWTVQSVSGTDGRDLRLEGPEERWRSVVDCDGESDDDEGNVLGNTVLVKAPGADRALKTIRGTAKVEISEIGVARLPFRAGESVEIEGAVIKILAIEAKDEEWEVRCVAARKPGAGRRWIRDILDGHFKVEGGPGWLQHFINERPGDKETAFEVTAHADKEPGWIEFRHLQKKRRVEVPFSFEDVRFDK